MLTRSEEKVLQYITRHIVIQGHAPTRLEICGALGFSSRGTADGHIKSLEKKGHIERDRSWGGLRLTGEATKRATVLPLVGRISAGKPIEAISNKDEINFSELLLGPDRYVLQVNGDSMIEAGIHDGDYVVIKHTNTAKTGDIVVALIDQSEATIKRLKKRRNGIELIPENKTMKPMVYTSDRVQIQGILVGQVRLY
jgi:repressor LexA